MATATFQWSSNSNERWNNAGKGCLFTVDSLSGNDSVSSNPSLTLVPPPAQGVKDENGTTNNSIKPNPGEDLSPPNAVDANRMNGIAIPFSASAGWSKSPPKPKDVYPSRVSYDLRLKTNSKNSSVPSDSLELALSLEYTNPHFENGESMMVKVALAKTLVQAEMGTELALVATRFQEYITQDNKWIDITADVDYTETANAVVDAVLKDPTAGQTAGKATVTAKTVDLSLGPFSAKARLHLTFQVEKLYSYEAMSLRTDASDVGSHRLLPLFVNLPFAPMDHEAGLTKLSVSFQAPDAACVMPVDEYSQAYHHLKNQDSLKTSAMLVVPRLTRQQAACSNGPVGYQYQWGSLPPRSCGILAWLALPNHVDDDDCGFDFVKIGRSLEELGGSVQPSQTKDRGQALVLVPSGNDTPSLQVPLPGHGPMGSLFRLKVKTPEAQKRQKPIMVINLTLSDRSGSTDRRVGGGSVTMRQRFNELAVARLLKRLESIPALVQAGVLRLDDVWMDAFLPFDNSAPLTAVYRFMFRVGDVHDSIVEVVRAIRSNNNEIVRSKLPSLVEFVCKVSAVQPGGLTDFSVAPRTLVQEYSTWLREGQTVMGSDQAIEPCTFVEFDTDGGHNGAGNYLESLTRLCEVFKVRNGVVTGFGSWLNQDCASKVARVLGHVPAQLALHIPEAGTEGLDKVFRRGFSAWVGSLRQPPKMTLKISAGGITFPTSLSTERTANVVEVLGLRRIADRYESLPTFGPPDVSNVTFTKTVIEGVPAGDELMIYAVSRIRDISPLLVRMEIEVLVEGAPQVVSKAILRSEEEELAGNYLAYNWLTMLTSPSGAKGLRHAALVATSLGSRLEDEVSFRFNIASPSGKTSYLGRCKTVADRDPIDAAHQPESPSSPLKIPTPQEAHGGFYSDCSVQPATAMAMPPPPIFSSFGESEPSTTRGFGSSARASILFGAAPQPSGGFGAPPSGSFGASPRGYTKFGSSAPAPGLFGAPASGSFGAPASGSFGAPPSEGFGAPPSGSFGASPRGYTKFGSSAPAPGLFGEPAFGAFGAPPQPPAPGGLFESAPRVKRSEQPSWMDALAVPVGSNVPLSKQDFADLRKAIEAVAHARNRLLQKDSVNFLCDVCHRSLALDEERFHCLDCQDFDACVTCKDTHKNLPFHRVVLVPSRLRSAPIAGKVRLEEDPLVNSLLSPMTGVVNQEQYHLQKESTVVDQTVVWCENQVRRFLFGILHWWPLFRTMCSFQSKLPVELSDDLAQKIVGPESLEDMLQTVSTIMDSLQREDKIWNQSHGGNAGFG